MMNAVLSRFVVAFFILPTLSHAQGASPVVHHCPTSTACANPGTSYAISGASDTIELFISPGTNLTPGGETVCLDGAGDEICGFTLVLLPTGDLSITSFIPNLSAESSLEGTGIVSHIDPTSNALRINRINALDGDNTTLWLGSLNVSNSGDGGEIRVDGSSEAVSANLALIPVTDNGPVAVPEPSFGLGALLAGGWLAYAARKRNLD